MVLGASAPGRGWVAARVALDPDELRADDVWWLAVRAADPAHCLPHALPDMPAVVADHNLIEKIRHGKPVTKKDLSFDPGFAKRNTHAANIKVVDTDNRLRAVLNFMKNQDKFSYACVFPN